jgi:site-specific DNA recombinase
VDRLVDAIANGADEFTEVGGALSKARAERERLSASIAEVHALPVIALHPTIGADYRRQVEQLNATIAADPAARLEAFPIIRGLIDRVEVMPSDRQRGVSIEVTGKLTALLALAAGEPVPEPMYGNGGAGSGDRTRITSLEG